MELKKCLYCNGEIIGKRYDAKFCGNTCKAKHWEGKKHSQPTKQQTTVISQLRGVLDGEEKINTVSKTTNAPSPVFDLVQPGEFNFARYPLEISRRRLSDVIKKADIEVLALQVKARHIASLSGKEWVLGLTGAGALIGDRSAGKNTHRALLGAGIGLLAGLFVRDATKASREEQKKLTLIKLRQDILDRLKVIQDKKKELNIVNEKLKELPPHSFLPNQLLVTSQKVIEANNLSGFLPAVEVTEPMPGLQTDVSDVSLPRIVSNKIISSQHLKKMDFKALDFQGKWKILFGYPSVNFHCVLHGMSGEGKSTFAIQFAKYLADSFGRVIYVSGEEGFSKTFKDKFSNNNAESKFLDVADLRTFDDIIDEVDPETYNFIFIDSLDNMKIDAAKMKVIRERYKNSALITISQSTKDGKMRGSYEIVHDCDMAVNVSKGIAVSTKNRFKEKGMTLEVFKS